MSKQLQELIDRYGANAVENVLNEYKKKLHTNKKDDMIESNRTERKIINGFSNRL